MPLALCSELITHCSKCKMDLNHMVILMDGGSPSRVKCLTCKSEHAYRDPTRAARRIAKSTITATPKQKTQARASLEEKDWRAKIEAKEQTPIPYNPSGTFKKESLIYHVSFGTGLIVDFIHPDKIQVFFDSGLKTLKGMMA